MRLTFARKEDRAARMEVEANRCAAPLLMPHPHFRKDLRLRKGADIDHILALARRYETSKEATARRYVDLQDEPCAIVVSHNGRILRLYRHEDFPFIDVERGDPVPSGSMMARTDLKQGVPSDSKERDGGIWLSIKPDAVPQRFGSRFFRRARGIGLLYFRSRKTPKSLRKRKKLEESWALRHKH